MRYPACTPVIRRYVDGFTTLLANLLGPSLTGVYLHGSLAMGCYTPPGSDIDIIAVVDAPLNMATLSLLGQALPDYADQRPGIGSIEFSIITLDAARHIPNPMPYEFHYSPSWHERLLHGDVDYTQPRFDPDLFAHITCIRQRGIVLTGMPVQETFGPVPQELYVSAVLEDFDWVLSGGQLYTHPVYSVLNICRVLQLLAEQSGTVYSKEEGGQWGLRCLPVRFVPLIEQALAAYRSEAIPPWDHAALLAFGEYAKQKIHPQK